MNAEVENLKEKMQQTKEENERLHDESAEKLALMDPQRSGVGHSLYSDNKRKDNELKALRMELETSIAKCKILTDKCNQSAEDQIRL
jgi:hypothetical protein